MSLKSVKITRSNTGEIKVGAVLIRSEQTQIATPHAYSAPHTETLGSPMALHFITKETETPRWKVEFPRSYYQMKTEPRLEYLSLDSWCNTLSLKSGASLIRGMGKVGRLNLEKPRGERRQKRLD